MMIFFQNDQELTSPLRPVKLPQGFLGVPAAYDIGAADALEEFQ